MTQHSPANVRPDIQALRALAVLAVVIYHVNSAWLPGGFVGVDIFFVISGFLITGQLWRQVERDGKVNFKDFWARRARRLLPASLLVILTTMIAAFIAVPKQQLSKYFGDALASTFYVQNFQLINRSTDYLEETALPSPFQHFWSLSVEEQYYIFWPVVLFVCLLTVARFRSNLKTVVTWALALIAMFSLAFSIFLTSKQPADAYFSTFTRAWEFALGALLAIALTSSRVKKFNEKNVSIIFWLGLGLIVVTLVTFDGNTPFPGFMASIPVLATAAMLASANQNAKLIPHRLLAWAPIQFFGNISYSFYLWHWPVLVILPWLIPGGTSLLRNLFAVSIAILLAWVSKQFVEDPIRFGKLSKLGSLRQIAITTALMLVVSGIGFGLTSVKPKTPKVASGINHVYRPEYPPFEAGQIKDCSVAKISIKFEHCIGGVKNAKVRVALLGDSHMRQYWVVLQQLAAKYQWQLTMLSKSACPVQDAAKYGNPNAHPSCLVWNQKLEKWMNDQKPFDLIINSNASFYTEGKAAVSTSFRSFVQKQAERGQQWLVIKDNPKPLKELFACLYAAKGRANELCSVTREQALQPVDDLVNSVSGLKRVTVVDPIDLFCSDVCLPVIDDKLQYRDFSHISWRASLRVKPLIDVAVPSSLKQTTN